MLLSEFRAAIEPHPDCNFAVVLPDGRHVLPHFHLTEVARVDKRFVDCGGTLRTDSSCVLQLWVAGDREHRLHAGKVSGILRKATAVVGDDDLPVEVDYEDRSLSRYEIVDVKPSKDRANLLYVVLGRKSAGCLAPDRCGIPQEAVCVGEACCC